MKTASKASPKGPGAHRRSPAAIRSPLALGFSPLALGFLALALGVGVSIGAANLFAARGAARTAAQTSGRAAKASPEAGPVEMTVTELPGRSGEEPAIAMSDVSVTQGHRPDEVVSWVPAQGQHAGLQLLVLIDDSDHIGRITDQLADLRNFIMQQPSRTEVGVGYMYNGLVNMQQDFTADHAAAAKAVHMPGSVGAASPYFSLMDMYKRGQWRLNPGYPRREVLMFTDGDDPYASPYYADPYIDNCIADMQRANMQVFTIFTSGEATRDDGFRGGTLMMELADPTGGYALYSGLEGSPISFTPYLDQLNYMLNHQYLLTFQVRPEGREDLVSVKVAAANVPDNKMVLVARKAPVPGATD